MHGCGHRQSPACSRATLAREPSSGPSLAEAEKGTPDPEPLSRFGNPTLYIVHSKSIWAISVELRPELRTRTRIRKIYPAKVHQGSGSGAAGAGRLSHDLLLRSTRGSSSSARPQRALPSRPTCCRCVGGRGTRHDRPITTTVAHRQVLKAARTELTKSIDNPFWL
jgi:hypothetical protein